MTESTQREDGTGGAAPRGRAAHGELRPRARDWAPASTDLRPMGCRARGRLKETERQDVPDAKAPWESDSGE